MENRVDWRIVDTLPSLEPFSSSDHNDNNNDLFQVMKAVEAAEVTIKQQVEENIRLRSELEYKTLELHRRKQLHEPSTAPRSPSSSVDMGGSHDQAHPQLFNQVVSETSSQSAADNEGYNENLVSKIYENEQEIMQLRNLLTDYWIKEAQIRNDKIVLEGRISQMRVVFDQQQQDLADAASKALVYRQDLIEENIRIAYALQDVQQERTTFISALLPILADHSLEPQIEDAQSIASKIKILFRHLHEKLVLTESKLKQYQYQVRPNSNQSSIANSIQHSSPSQSISASSDIPNKNRLQMVTHTPFSHESDAHSQTTPPNSSDLPNKNRLEMVTHPSFSHESNAHSQTTAPNWDQSDVSESASTSVDIGNMKQSEPENSTSTASAVTTKPTIARLDANKYKDDTTPCKHVKFCELEMQTHTDYDDHNEEYNDSQGNSPSSSYPQFLSPVHEDLFLDEDDPLPAIEGLQISGEALPGRELQASGYSINGTTSCNFEWIRHLPDGSVNYIEGAKQPNYLLTADDVDTYLAIEVQPLDDRKRKGELVKVFANDHKKITCDPEMQSQLQKFLQKGNGTFEVFEFTGFLDIWEPATLAIMRGAYSIKRSSEPSVRGAVKFSHNTMVSIPCGSPSEFIITDSDIVGVDADRLLKTEDASYRDTLVLILRLFILRAIERRTKKGKKRVLFF